MRRIAHISDLHFGRHSLTVMEDLLRSLQDSAVDLVVLSGDLTQRARAGEFQQARLFLNRIERPQLIVPGNHDIPLYNLFERWLKPLARFDRHIGPLTHASDMFCDDELAVLGLNTAQAFLRKGGRIWAEQVGSIARSFAALSPEVVKVIVSHHPLAGLQDHPGLQVAKHARLAMNAIAGAGVHLLLSGHHHRTLSGGASMLAAGATVLVVYAGTAMSTRTRGGEGNSYNLIDIETDTVRICEMGWLQNSAFVPVAVRAYRLHDGRWRSVEARHSHARPV